MDVRFNKMANIFKKCSLTNGTVQKYFIDYREKKLEYGSKLYGGKFTIYYFDLYPYFYR